MADRYYSTKTTLDWIVAHYLLDAQHYVWVAPEFYPFRRLNPNSSNPLWWYSNYFSAWRDRDEFSPIILTKRLNIRNVIDLSVERGRITKDLGRRVKEAVDTADISFFYPIVYVVDMDVIDEPRRLVDGSGVTVGSAEYLIEQLAEDEFSLLFDDFKDDPELAELVGTSPYLDSYQLVETIDARRRSDGHA